MQRMREQRLYEKLQGKKQQRIAPIKLTKSGKNQQEAENPPESFIPDPDDGTSQCNSKYSTIDIYLPIGRLTPNLTYVN